MTPQLKLSDRAFRLRAIINEFGGHPSLSDLLRATGRSQATIYRCLAELADAGHNVALSARRETEAKPVQKKIRRSYRA